jgi:hypothetical protein
MWYGCLALDFDVDISAGGLDVNWLNYCWWDKRCWLLLAVTLFMAMAGSNSCMVSFPLTLWATRIYINRMLVPCML